eukprot:CAMPEP_0171147984 /NCGR_PEP_ID=MMETSP0766_2-20121228/148339_1 /TAXON_ID=439317 /ORGANISM="Gambierdiscus australes, Strain CAWD 149" /LENGTH=586 /DNA_ID=CAMNT_0011611893 /DNA_START=56 /DNA_END=1816 /DNA_ORIENTATION=-
MAEEKETKTDVKDAPRSWPVIILCIFGFLVGLYIFLLGLQLLGDSFKCLGGKGAGSMFTAINDPIAGLMTGILATVMVQSSSTSTSIVVGLVGAGQVTVKQGIPIIMGANIGTSVTNTIVSMGQSGDRLMLERAFAGATVHDMFNYLTVATLLPIEIIIAAIQGEGGPLYWLTYAITDAIMADATEGEGMFPSPTKEITSPVAKLFISNNKYIINALSLGKPEVQTPNTTNCTSRRLVAEPDEHEEPAGEPFGTNRTLLSRRLDGVDCSHYYCISKNLDKNFKKISSKAYASKLTACGDYITEPAEPCSGSDKCYLDALGYWDDYVENGRIIKGGFLEGAGDVGGGIIALVFALLFLIGGLIILCKCLQFMMMNKAKTIILYATKLNDYLALLIGLAITIIVQSSSVTTSALTPFCGIGVLPLTKMLPMTLGANIGTTITALIAAVASPSFGSLHIALCHLFFNIIGILIFFPAPPMRRIPLSAAKTLGLYASYYRAVPAIYILVSFVIVPGIALGISALFGASVAGGVIVLIIVLAALGGFIFWWAFKGGCYKVISKEQREERQQELEQANETGAGEGEQNMASV